MQTVLFDTKNTLAKTRGCWDRQGRVSSSEEIETVLFIITVQLDITTSLGYGKNDGVFSGRCRFLDVWRLYDPRLDSSAEAFYTGKSARPRSSRSPLSREE